MVKTFINISPFIVTMAKRWSYGNLVDTFRPGDVDSYHHKMKSLAELRGLDYLSPSAISNSSLGQDRSKYPLTMAAIRFRYSDPERIADTINEVKDKSGFSDDDVANLIVIGIAKILNKRGWVWRMKERITPEQFMRDDDTITVVSEKELLYRGNDGGGDKKRITLTQHFNSRLGDAESLHLEVLGDSELEPLEDEYIAGSYYMVGC